MNTYDAIDTTVANEIILTDSHRAQLEHLADAVGEPWHEVLDEALSELRSLRGVAEMPSH